MICKKYSLGFLILSIALFFLSLKFMMNDQVVLIEYDFLKFNSVNISMVLLFDWMSLLFMSFVLFISSMVIYYSYEYMMGDKSLDRFILLVVMFVLSMMLLIISPNLVSILLGWDGLGLVSYCLVIYYQNFKSFNAGMLTALSNRVGDVALLLAIAWMLNYGSWNYYFYLSIMKHDMELQVVTWLVILAGITKSAQIPFSSWLPAAMAAPTPVSSLVHSSTLVTAGVYLLIRFSSSLSFTMMFVLMFLSSMTMFMAGLGANYEYDLKKIIALSTLSQLGLMMSILSMGEFYLSFFHLLTHALFKALLFMCSGVIIHNMMNYQDIRCMGGLIYKLPLTCSLFSVSNFALCGLPFLAGFYSKDLMLESYSMSYLNLFMYVCFFLSTGLTVCYSVRLSYYVLTGKNNFYSLNSCSESGLVMLTGMMGLILFVIIGGSMLMWIIFPTPMFIFLPIGMKFMTLLVIIIGGLMGYEVSQFKLNYMNYSLIFSNYSYFVGSMWFMPYLSSVGAVKFPLNMGNKMFKKIDMGWSEIYGSQGIMKMYWILSPLLRVIFKNNLKIFIMLLVFWLILMFMI
uniref:NADH-ubiquinone oxidoreductase chain 5 n=1 Tax=Euspilotus scissus TaxID=694456 RepID=D8WKP4_9COLE|nr:NADH dehydrogenase subunit 5 [Euspilotus scissus]ACZ58577.1 NADH dehydrogenase subunit 5 [Euspilotus scissus]